MFRGRRSAVAGQYGVHKIPEDVIRRDVALLDAVDRGRGDDQAIVAYAARLHPAAIAASITLACVSMAEEPGKVLDSTAWNWSDLTAKKTEVGELRSVVRQPTRDVPAPG